MSTKQNRTIITTTEQVTPLLLLSAMGREVNGICLEWISAPVTNAGETYDWKCGITADGRTHTVEAETGPLGVIEAGLRRVQNARVLAESEKGRGGEGERGSPNGLDTSMPRPRRILIHGPAADEQPLDCRDFDACAVDRGALDRDNLSLYQVQPEARIPAGRYSKAIFLKWYGVKTEVAP